MSAPVAEALCSFVNKAPTPMHFVSEARNILTAAGFTELRECEKWEEIPDKFFVSRDERAFLAINKTDLSKGTVVGGHIDTPCYRCKPNSKLAKCGCEQARVAQYGQSFWLGWQDRCLRAAGRVIYEADGQVKSSLFNSDDSIGIISSLAVHLDRTAGTKPTMNLETSAMPIIGLTPDQPLPESNQAYFLLEKISEIVGCKPDEIIDFDLTFYDANDVKVIGINKELIAGARLSNIGLAYLALKAFSEVEKPESGFIGFVVYDAVLTNGEQRVGPKSNLLQNVLKNIGCPISSIMQSKFIGIGAEQAAHPNKGGSGKTLGSGVTTEVSKESDCQFVDFVTKNTGMKMDMATIPVLAKFAVRETAAVCDMQQFYEKIKGDYGQ